MSTVHPVYQKVVITAIREEVPGVKTFTIAGSNGALIPYAAGQFITFVFTHHGREERRSFSISSSSDMNEPVSFTVKRVDNGAYSRLLVDRAKPGDMLYTTGASGLFTLPEDSSNVQQVFFFAAGIGITPIFSLIKTVLSTRPYLKVVLIYSNRSKEEVVFYNELSYLEEKHPDQLTVEFLYSTSFNLGRARLNKELLPILIKEYGKVPTDQMLFYICGPFVYMRMAILTLEEQGIKDEQITKENFNTNERVVTHAESPDKTTHNVTLSIAGNTYSFPVEYPDTILLAAKKSGIALPYSCETGRCGSCSAICTQGTVWMSYNEVLMDSDLKKGMVLTCVGHPVGRDVVLSL